MLKVAIDAGGTFTDVAVLHPHGRLSSHKVLSDPLDPAQGMLRALDASVALDGVSTIVNGTTAGLNAVLARTGTPVLAITTHGFRDVLQIGRAERTDVWQLRYKAPEHLVGSEDVCTVRGRILFDGSVFEPLSVDDLEQISERIASDGVDSVAVCLLHSTVNPEHELAVRDILVARHPGLHVSLSHLVAPEVGEFERFSSTVVNAYVAATVGNYLARVTDGLAERGYGSPLLVMRSSGGVTSAGSARERPMQTLLSGPAGGVVGTQAMAKALAVDRLLGIDMGGTSLDACVVIDQRLAVASELVIDRLPILMPVVDLVTISAGGGSVAWEQSGSLHVGPHSAGSDPGPASYGLGGTVPTVTDANVVLGRLGLGGLADDAIMLDRAAAVSAFEPLADALGLSVEQVAEAVLDITDARMSDALRTLTVRRGQDPRDFAILAFGGAGPLHAAAMADELGIARVIIPPTPGVFSAWGMLHAPIRHDVAQPILVVADSLLSADLEAIHERLLTGARDLVRGDGVDPDTARYIAGADIRYVGQQFSVTVEQTMGATVDEWHQEFRNRYRAAYGIVAGDPPVEFANVRITAVGPYPELSTGDGETGQVPPAAPINSHVVYHGRRHEAIVCDRRSIADDGLAGPAIVLDSGATIFVPPTWSVAAGPVGTLILSKENA